MLVSAVGCVLGGWVVGFGCLVAGIGWRCVGIGWCDGDGGGGGAAGRSVEGGGGGGTWQMDGVGWVDGWVDGWCMYLTVVCSSSVMYICTAHVGKGGRREGRGDGGF